MPVKKTDPRTFEVLISFSGLNVGERFTQDPDDLGWALSLAAAGYLREVKAEVVADAGGSDPGQG